MTQRDWTLVLFGFPVLGAGLLVAFSFAVALFGFATPYGLGGSWLLFILVSPIAALIFLRSRNAPLAPAFGGLLVNFFLSLVITYPVLLGLWAFVLCEPGAHDMCAR
jgi:hypothetical protein